MVEEIFQLGVNDVSNPYQHNKKMVIAKLKSISYPLINKEDFNNKLYHKLVSDLQYSLSQDAIAQYLKALRKRYSVKIMPLATLSGE
jgi:predicted nucleotidyltransferase